MWTVGFDKGDLREHPSSFLKRKESKVRGENFDFAWTRGKWRGFLDVCLEKSQGRSEVELGDCMASQVLVFGFINMHETLALCVEFPLVACGGNFYYTISCIMLN